MSSTSFTKPGPHVFKDAAIPISLVGPHVVESLLSPSPKTLETTFLFSKATGYCNEFQLNSLLKLAIANTNSPLVSALIDTGADPNGRDSDERPVMSLAVRSGDVDVVRVLIESSCTIQHPIDRFLHEAAEMERLDLMKVLCLGFKEIDVNSIDLNGRPPLHIAAIHGNIELL
ncbi:protein VAPYRIN-LIKE-like [Cornus florida]|uniref:protein VAPYRIN-LIKE-like n=1 Tax=Cornus florida TaxID=4283 RepID=UPI00289D6FD3|nr:protein VAPYRIN-LIKE-like [Cornus florida]